MHVHGLMASQDFEGILEVLEGGLKLTHQEVANAGLEVCYAEVVVKRGGSRECLNL